MNGNQSAIITYQNCVFWLRHRESIFKVGYRIKQDQIYEQARSQHQKTSAYWISRPYCFNVDCTFFASLVTKLLAGMGLLAYPLVCVTAISVYFLNKDLNLIASRLKTDPACGKEKSQKLANSLITIFFVLLILIPPFDHRFQWSNVPAYLALTGNVFVALGLLIVFLFLRRTASHQP